MSNLAERNCSKERRGSSGRRGNPLGVVAKRVGACIAEAAATLSQLGFYPNMPRIAPTRGKGTR